VKALVAGWFSYENSDYTAGDLLASDVVCEWLRELGVPFDVAVASSMKNGVNLRQVTASDYAIVVFVCGPFMRNAWEADFLFQFADTYAIGVNLSFPFPLEHWNPFDAVIERDSNRTARPDISLLSQRRLVPVVGLCLCEPYGEADVPLANSYVERLVQSKEMAVIPVDTRLDVNATGLRTSSEVESALARMDAVITTRLHGTVLSLRNGVPALVIDPEVGGGRIYRQAMSLEWPIAFTVDRLDDQVLSKALDRCLSEEARQLASQCATAGIAKIQTLKLQFAAAVHQAAGPSPKQPMRLAFAREHGFGPGGR
jgi:hypothetical protein